MGKRIIYTPKAPNPAGPYSQAVESNDFIFLSGQLPADSTADIKIQTKQVLDNIKVVLEEAGLGLENVVKTTIYITDLSKFSVVNEVYKEYFVKEPPARSTVGVSSLPKGVGIEIDVVATKKSEASPRT